MHFIFKVCLYSSYIFKSLKQVHFQTSEWNIFVILNLRQDTLYDIT